MEETIPRKVRFVAIDPGSRTLGFVVLEYNLDTGELKVLFTRCLDVDEALKHLKYMSDLLGTRRSRLYVIHRFLMEMIREWSPSVVVMETPFMGSFAQVYKVLVEVMGVIENIVADFGNGISLIKIDPSTVKKTIGVSGKSGDKTLMLDGVKLLLLNKAGTPIHLTLVEGIDLDTITEHEIDGIAIGHWFCKTELIDLE